MKRKHLLIGAMLVSAFASCKSDDAFTVGCYIQNDTPKEVTVIAEGHKHWSNSTDKNSYVIASGSACEVAFDGDKGTYPTVDYAKNVMLYYLGDSVSFRFGDETQLVYYKNDTKGNSPYNLNSDLYYYTSDKNSGNLIFKLIE